MSAGNQVWQCKCCGTLISYNYQNWKSECPGCGSQQPSWTQISGDDMPKSSNNDDDSGFGLFGWIIIAAVVWMLFS